MKGYLRKKVKNMFNASLNINYENNPQIIFKIHPYTNKIKEEDHTFKSYEELIGREEKRKQTLKKG